MATYDVRIEADKASVPVLLANGNPVEQGELDDGRHYATWHDPWPKPSYLFALVGGDLACVDRHLHHHVGPRG
jgi:aminopeptidase N